MNGAGTRRWPEIGEPLHKADHGSRCSSRCDHADDLFGARDIAVHRKNEGPGTPSGLIIHPDQRIKPRQCSVLISRYAKRECKTPCQLIRRAGFERCKVIFLRLSRVAHQIKRKAPILNDARFGHSKRGRFLKGPQRLPRLLHHRESTAKTRLSPRVTWR